MSSSEKFDSLVGQIIDKRYEVLSVIGEGGMAVVFKARDLITERIVAVKVLNESADTDGHALKRFLNESKAIAMLSHENIVKIYDVSVGKELKYIVMEHVDGDTLKGYMDKKGKKLSLEETISFTEQILLALEHAHSKGVIHRDIKPHNMMVLKNGFLKVTDFGIAKTPSGDTISMTDKALGTVHYISPEQASGKATGTFSDIYSVGVMLYEMATGTLPFNADTPVSVAMKQINDDPEPPTSVCHDLPRGMEQIILKAMNKDPEKRFKSAHSMLRALRILKENPLVVFEEKKPAPSNAKSNTKGAKSLQNGVLGKLSSVFVSSEKTDVRKQNGSKGKSKITLFPIILGMTTAFFLTLIVVGAIFIGSLVKSSNDPSNDPIFVTVPELVGTLYDESVIEELENEHFNVEVIWAEKRNDAYDFGEIYATTPEGGQVKKVQGSLQNVNLVLYVNPEEGSSVLADYSIQTVNSARIALKNLGYTNVTVIKESHDTVLENYVFKTEPEAGQPVKTTDEIILYVSTGKPLKNVLSMPDMVGKTRGEAMVELKDFNVEFLTVADEADVGTVIWQSIEPYTVISPDFCDKITLYVSDGALSEETTQPFYVVMPDLYNLTLEEARDKMTEIASFGIKVVYEAKAEALPVGVVCGQSVEAGSTVLINHTKPITVYYSDGSLIVDEPTVDEPTVDEPTVDEPTVDEPVTDNVTDTPVSDDTQTLQ